MSHYQIPGATRETIRVGETEVSYQRIGNGPNLVFVHGWPLNGNTWRNVVSYLEGYTCWIIDLPGAGHSGRSANSPLSVQSHVSTVVGLLDTLGLDDVVFVAQDSGGMITRYVAAQRPELVDALVLIGTEIPNDHAKLVVLFKLLGALPGARHMFGFSMGNRFVARTPLILGGTVHDTSFLNGEFRANLLDPILADLEAMAGVVEMIRNFSFDDIDALADVHAELTMDTLLIFGEDDTFFPIEKARDMVRQFAGATTFVTMPNAKLFVHEEYPQLVATKIREFLATVAAGSRPI